MITILLIMAFLILVFSFLAWREQAASRKDLGWMKGGKGNA